MSSWTHLRVYRDDHFFNNSSSTNADIIAAERNWRAGFLSHRTSHWLRGQVITLKIKNMLSMEGALCVSQSSLSFFVSTRLCVFPVYLIVFTVPPGHTPFV